MPKKIFRLILASQSPQRRQLLREAGFRFTTCPSNSSERFSKNLTLADNLRAIVTRKAKATLKRLSYRKDELILILSADTVVVFKNRVLGKPKNRDDASRMLRLLAGKTHSVKTAFQVFSPSEDRKITRIVTTRVRFRDLSEREIQSYLDSGEPFDKAGSYAVQGRARDFVVHLKGDFSNVVGLPVERVRKEFRKNHWNVSLRRKSQSRSRKNSKR